MQYHYKFEKILTLKEREKNQSQNQYTEAVKVFESEAEKLYRMLKKKEELLDNQSEKLKAGLSVQEVRHNQTYLENQERQIDHLQKRVVDSRNKMQFYHQILIEKNIEVKKYEKMKARDFDRFYEATKADENRQMDEISIQQFMSRA